MPEDHEPDELVADLDVGQRPRRAVASRRAAQHVVALAARRLGPPARDLRDQEAVDVEAAGLEWAAPG